MQKIAIKCNLFAFKCKILHLITIKESEQVHTPHTPTLFDNATHNKLQCLTLVMSN